MIGTGALPAGDCGHEPSARVIRTCFRGGGVCWNLALCVKRKHGKSYWGRDSEVCGTVDDGYNAAKVEDMVPEVTEDHEFDHLQSANTPLCSDACDKHVTRQDPLDGVNLLSFAPEMRIMAHAQGLDMNPR